MGRDSGIGCVVLVGAMLAHGAGPAMAQEPTGVSQGSAGAFAPQHLPMVEATRTSEPVTIDARLDEAVWTKAPRLTGFTEVEPANLAEPPVGTEARVLYDDTHLYVAVVAEADPDRIRAALRDRDEIWADDYVGVILDPYGDALLAYGFYANGLGVQGDARYVQGAEEVEFDAVFASAGRTTPEGYVVEMAIPFDAMAFPGVEEQGWRMTIWRSHPRDRARTYSWAALRREDPCWVCQLGTLAGLRDLRLAHRLELLPSVIADRSSSRPADGDGRWSTTGPEVEAALGARYRLSPELAAELTLNPDFSQIEADPALIDVNTPFALSLPERRPFFQAGAGLLRDPLGTLYTRSINDPAVAAKLTGRAFGADVLYVGARDERTPVLVPLVEQTGFVAADASTSQILRVRRSFGESSYVGLALTDRRLRGGAESLGAVDGSYRFRESYSFDWQLALSRTDEPSDTTLTPDLNGLRYDRGRHTAGFDGEELRGHAVYASFERDTRPWSFVLLYTELSPSFRAGNGFVVRNAFRRALVQQDLEWQVNRRWIDRVNLEATATRDWDHPGGRRYDRLAYEFELDLRGQTALELEYGREWERFRGEWFEGVDRLEIEVESAFAERIAVGAAATYGEFIARNLTEPVLGRGTEAEVRVNMRPLRDVVVESSLGFARLHGPAGEPIFSGWIARSRIDLQLNRELRLRLFGQYDDFDETLGLQPLLSYELNPFSIFFIGATLDYDRDTRHALRARERQLFLKLQYLFKP